MLEKPITLLRQKNVDAWNQYRDSNPDYVPCLKNQVFRGDNLANVNFSRADIRGAKFIKCTFENASFREARAGLPNKYWEIFFVIASFILLGFFVSLSSLLTTTLIFQVLEGNIPKLIVSLSNQNISAWEFIGDKILRDKIIAEALEILFFIGVFIVTQISFGILALTTAGIVVESRKRKVLMTLGILFGILIGFEFLFGFNLLLDYIGYNFNHLFTSYSLITFAIFLFLRFGWEAFWEILILSFLGISIAVFLIYNFIEIGNLDHSGYNRLFFLFFCITIVIVTCLVGIVGWSALNNQKEELTSEEYIKYSKFREVSSFLSSIPGTSFYDTLFINCDFSAARLQNTNLKNSSLPERCTQLKGVKGIESSVLTSTLKQQVLQYLLIYHCWIFETKSNPQKKLVQSVFEPQYSYRTPRGIVYYSRKIEKPKNLCAINLEGAENLGDSDFSAVNLSYSNLSGANMKKSNFRVSNLSGASLNDSNLMECDFRGANLKGANLSRANLNKSDLREILCDDKTSFLNAIFSRATLRNIYLAGCLNLEGADFQMADLSGANLAGTNLRGSNFFGADLSGADLRNADLSGANLSAANLVGAILYEAKLIDANLNNANLQNASLEDAFLSGAQALSTNFTGTVLTGVRIDRWVIDATTQFNRVVCKFFFDIENDIAKRIPSEGINEEGDFDAQMSKFIEMIDIVHDLPSQYAEPEREIVKSKIIDSVNQLNSHKDGLETFLNAIKKDPKFSSLQSYVVEINHYYQNSAFFQDPYRVEIMQVNDQSRNQNVNPQGDLSITAHDASTVNINQQDVSGQTSGQNNLIPSDINSDQDRLRDLLHQLQQAIETDIELGNSEKEEALTELRELTTAAQNPKESRMQKAAKGSINALKGIASGLSDASKLASASKELLPLIQSILSSLL